MKPFGEEFPSLKGKLLPFKPLESFNQFTMKDIQENCLDRRKVMKAITKCSYWDNSISRYALNKDELLKELGL